MIADGLILNDLRRDVSVRIWQHVLHLRQKFDRASGRAARAGL